MRKPKFDVMKGLVVTSLVLCADVAMAWDGTVTGVIQGADVTDGPNYAFRIDLQGSPPLCGNLNTWAFLNTNTPNYQVYVATLLAAKTTGVQITVYTTREAGTGYCKIGYVRTLM